MASGNFSDLLYSFVIFAEVMVWVRYGPASHGQSPMTPDIIDIPTLALCVSISALLLSAATAWFTLFHRGTLRATRPTVICFGYDQRESVSSAKGSFKIFLRTLLYTTGSRGKMVEHMYARVTRGDQTQSFSVWVYDVERGSGLYIGPTGLAADHHFLSNQLQYQFDAGEYKVTLFAKCVGDREPVQLLDCGSFQVEKSQADAVMAETSSLVFDWSSESKTYAGVLKPQAIVRGQS